MRSLRLLCSIFLGLAGGFAQQVGDPTDALDKVSVDELFSVQVTSVGRKAQALSKSAAAVFVLTADDIRRSGASSIPEALQWVPGLTALRVDGRSWVVSARGGARLYADKILVMVDGRSLYTPLFSGVIWDAISISMEDIEQIEVVRGPGAVMWGPNAVNGVINIITRNARQTKGAVVSVAGGNELRNSTETRWGGEPSDRLAYRVWGMGNYRTPAFGNTGYFRFVDRFVVEAPPGDLDTGSGQLGFRIDGRPNDRDQWMLQGGVYRLDRQDSIAYPVMMPGQVDAMHGHSDYQGGFVQGRWTRSRAAGNESALQFSFDKIQLDYPFMYADVNNLTVDYQNRRQTGERNEIYWGIGYQQYWDDSTGGRFLVFEPGSSTMRDGDAVIRDEFQIIPGRLLGSAGVRVDYSNYGRWQYQPSLRLLYTPNARQSAWLAVSRAVRSPSRWDRDLEFRDGSIMVPFSALPVQVSGSGSKRAPSEVERSLEAGYRVRAGQRWSVDTSGFFSYYNRLRAYAQSIIPEISFAGGIPVLSVPATASGSGSGRSYGGEIWGTWQIASNWRLMPSYSYLNETRWLPPTGWNSYIYDGTPATLPHQGAVRSQHNLSRTVKLDLTARARSRDRNLDLPGVLILDARIGWRPTRSGEFSIAVQDLANRHVVECYPEGVTIAVPTRRTVVFRWTQHF